MNTIITRLRDLIPQRALDTREAMMIAEKQALHMRRLLDLHNEPLLPEGALRTLPGVHVETVTGLDVSGATRQVAGTWIVLLNQDEPPVRQRFSLAHELKHVIDDHAIDKLYPRQGWLTAKDRAEKVCDFFAACLLMPRPLVKRLYSQGVQNPLDLGRRFEVSPQAMNIRLHQIGLVDNRRCDGVRTELTANQLLAA